MHSHSLSHWAHEHSFLGARHDERARRTWSVVALTAAMMIVEIVGGTVFGSIALIADGWHMGTHVLALAVAGLRLPVRPPPCRRFAVFARHRQVRRTGGLRQRHHPRDDRGSASATNRCCGSCIRSPIAFREAIPIAALGLCVNLASAWLLRESHDHAGHAHAGHGHAGHDHHASFSSRPRWTRTRRHAAVMRTVTMCSADSNYRAAYLHVLADALTSVLTIGGLSVGLGVGPELH